MVTEEIIAKNNIRVQRFKDATWFSPTNMPDVTIFGVGSLGSYLAFFLGRMDCKLHIVDFDSLEGLNSSAQFYPIAYCKSREPKVNSLRSWLDEFIGRDLSIEIENVKVDDSYILSSPIVFSCFDNMAARKILFSKWLELESRELFIDLRANMEEFSVFIVQKNVNEQRYLDEFFDDSALPDLPCSLKSTSHCSAMCASIATGLFTNYLSNKNMKEDLRDLPFSTKISIPISLYETNY